MTPELHGTIIDHIRKANADLLSAITNIEAAVDDLQESGYDETVLCERLDHDLQEISNAYAALPSVREAERLGKKGLWA